MKTVRLYLLIAASSLALVIVLIIQVNWILETAKIKEELFNEKANLVLAKTAEALSRDTQTCMSMELCMDKPILDKIDSIFLHYLRYYNIEIDYSFQVRTGVAIAHETPFEYSNSPDHPAYYRKKLDEQVSKNGLELILTFPEKDQFILAEMGVPFFTSVVLILIVLFLFWRTILSLIREQKISSHTRDFLNNMAHEFKTPLTNISLAGKIMQKDSVATQPDKLKHYAEIVLKENDRLRLRVEQVLNMSALERNEIPLQKTSVNIHLLLNDAYKCMQVQLENSKGKISLDLRAERTILIGDIHHLTNAICNLLDNAIKYSVQTPIIKIQTKNENNSIIISVEDNGTGIEKEYQKKVFDKFFRIPTGNIHDVKGFGLGLPYVKRIIELHNGSVKLRSEKNNGTCFIISLPNA